MRKSRQLLVLLLMVSMVLGLTSIGYAADQPIAVTIDGKAIYFPDGKPFIQNSRVLVPIRFVSEALGAKVDWDAKTETVTITDSGKVITLEIMRSYAYVNDKQVWLDTRTSIYDGRTYVPLRFVSQSLGCFVNWTDWNRTVSITTQSPYGEGKAMTIGSEKDKVTGYEVKLPFRYIEKIVKADEKYIHVYCLKEQGFSVWLDHDTYAGVVTINGSDYTREGKYYVYEYAVKDVGTKSIEGYSKIGVRFNYEADRYFYFDNPLKQ